MRKNNLSAFSLVELMIVVGIIGILVTIVVPRVRLFKAKVRQSEAAVLLNHIYNLHQTYLAENAPFTNCVDSPLNISTGSCADPTYCWRANCLGFKIVNCRARNYDYFVANGGVMSPFNVMAVEAGTSAALPGMCPSSRTIMPECAVTLGNIDIWTIDEDHEVQHFRDATKACP